MPRRIFVAVTIGWVAAVATLLAVVLIVRRRVLGRAR
jgi:hypothetical protein